MNKLIKALVFACGLSVAAIAGAKELKIGVINGADIVQKYQYDIEKKITDEFKPQEDALRKSQDSLKQLADKIDRDKDVMAKAELDKLKQEFETKQRDLQQKGMEFGENVNKRRQDEFQKLLDKVTKVIDDVAKKEQYDVILQKAATAYHNPQYDITKDILAALQNAK